MENVLTQTELDAKKFEVLNYLHTENADLTFHVIDERDEDPQSNYLLVRASFFNGVERFSRKIQEGFEEFACIVKIDPTCENLTPELAKLNEQLKKDMKKVA